MIYLILAGVLFLGAVFFVCALLTKGYYYYWKEALKLFGAICAGAAVLTLVGFLIKMGMAQLLGGM